jgi:hypothetical protein
LLNHRAATACSCYPPAWCKNFLKSLLNILSTVEHPDSPERDEGPLHSPFRKRNLRHEADQVSAVGDQGRQGPMSLFKKNIFLPKSFLFQCCWVLQKMNQNIKFKEKKFAEKNRNPPKIVIIRLTP